MSKLSRAKWAKWVLDKGERVRCGGCGIWIRGNHDEVAFATNVTSDTTRLPTLLFFCVCGECKKKKGKNRPLVVSKTVVTLKECK